MTLRSYPESPELAQVIDELASHGPELLPELDGALRAGLLSESPAGLAFRHEPMREAIYHDLAPPLRQAIHREVASALTCCGCPGGAVGRPSVPRGLRDRPGIAPVAMQQLAFAMPNSAITRYPFVLFPTFVVPVSILLHAAAMWRLKSTALASSPRSLGKHSG